MVRACGNGLLYRSTPGILRVLTSALLFGGAAHCGQSKTPRQYEIIPDELFTESALLQKRLDSPGDYFLLDGYYAAVLGELFYTSHHHDNFNLWPLHSAHTLANGGFPPLPKDRHYHVYGTVGNEVGDPMFFELTRPPEKWENHTPYTEAALQFSPIPPLMLGAAFEQNDHFSGNQATFKHKTLNQEKAAWFGENMPSRSLLLGGAEYRGNLYQVSGLFSGGWLWTPSPATGFYYPWQGGGVELNSVLWKRLKFQGDFQNWNSLSIWHDGGHITRGGLTGTLTGTNLHFLTKINWKLHGGSRYFSLALKELAGPKPSGWPMAPSFTTHRRFSIPLGAEIASHTPLRDSGLIISSNIAATLENTQINSNLEVEVRERMPFGHVFQRLNAYYWNPEDLYLPIVEKFGLPSLGKTVFLSDNDFLGIAATAGAGINLHPVYVSVDAAIVLEPNNLVFKTDTLFELNGLWLRSGSYLSLKTPLLSTVENLKAEVRLPWGWRAGATARLRYFMGESATSLDYLPSLVTCGLSLRKKVRTNLFINGLTHFVSEKEVRHWRENDRVFRVSAHWEHGFSLVQTFWGNALKFHFTALNAFGEDLLEHPNGNALRFHIMAGGEARF